MPSSRTRLRPWLEQKIESKSIPGLTWVDKGNKMFAIPWKHAARHGWEMDTDARIFMQWAVHTGKFKPGVTEPDPKTWKANFRSALNSLPDIKQVKDKSINKGSQAIRVYRMLEEVPKKKDKKPKTTHKRKIKNAEWDTNPEQDCKDQLNHSGAQSTDTSNESTQETTVDSTGGLGLSVHHFGDEGEAVECSTTVEVIADSTNEFYGLFQVSPIHTTDFEDDEAAIIEMAQALEVEQLQWQQTNANAPEMDMKYCKELKGLSGNMEDSSNCENSETPIILFSAQLPLCSST